jgi:tRNA (guanine-N7-)-methyltransferase
VGKNKLARFEELNSFEHVVQPTVDDVFNKKHQLAGNWAKDFFKNDNPIVLELGCGKGEYTVNLAREYPNKNFIGIDIKGARIWRGALTSLEEKLTNVGFLRTRIELINSFFIENEISEIWITFPDPQLKKRRAKKRLTAAKFLNSYAEFLEKKGLIHLKTDSDFLYEYTLQVVEFNKLPLLFHHNDIYNANEIDPLLTSIQTHYESLFRKEGQNITYIKFQLNGNSNLEEPPEPEE